MRPPIALTARLLCAITTLALAACGTLGPLARGYLDIEPAELQARIAPRFPMHHCKLVVACLDLANPVVVLTEGDDRIGVTADAKVTLGTRERTGRLGLSARPRYAPAEGQLFLEDLQVTTLELAGLPAEYAEVAKLYAPQLAKDVLLRRPVYTVDTHTAKGALAKLTVKDVKVVGGKLRISFSEAGG